MSDKEINRKTNFMSGVKFIQIIGFIFEIWIKIH